MNKTRRAGDLARQPMEEAREPVPDGPSPFEVTPWIDSRRIYEILLDRGLSLDDANTWWITPNARVGGRSPIQMWLSEAPPTEALIRIIRDAAFADTPN